MKAGLTEVIQAIQPGAVGSFNILDLDMAQAVIDSAESLHLPVIIGIASRHFDAINAPMLVPSLLKMIESCTQPVALHLDHAGPQQMDMIHDALELGFTSIMIDGSQLPYDENVKLTARVVDLARAYNAGVEGELGAVAGEEGVADTDSDAPEILPYTWPDEASRFVEQTGVDALAIAVGTAHGLYTQEPHIHYDTIRNVAAGTQVPLVMHGATGVSDQSIQMSVNLGIRKINFFSGLLQCAMDEVRNSASLESNDYLALKQRSAKSWRKMITQQMTLYADCTANSRLA